MLTQLFPCRSRLGAVLRRPSHERMAAVVRVFRRLWYERAAAAVRLCAGGKGSGCAWRWWKIRPVRGPEWRKMADILTLFAQTEKIAISTWHFSIFPLIIQSYILPLQCQVCKSKHVERHFK